MLTTPSGSTSRRCFLTPPCIPVNTYWPGEPWDSRTKKSPSWNTRWKFLISIQKLMTYREVRSYHSVANVTYLSSGMWNHAVWYTHTHTHTHTHTQTLKILRNCCLHLQMESLGWQIRIHHTAETLKIISKVSPCLITQYDMQAYGEGHRVACTFDLGIRWRWMGSFIPWPL